MAYFLDRSTPSLAHFGGGADSKPLVGRGARQTGKSSSGCAARAGVSSCSWRLNLERFADLTLVRSCRSPEDLLKAWPRVQRRARFPERTLLFLDEIQESPEAIQWLRFFREDHPQALGDRRRLAAGRAASGAGLLLPVGRVTFRTLRPLGFREFLLAVGKDVLADGLRAGEIPGAGPDPRPARAGPPAAARLSLRRRHAGGGRAVGGFGQSRRGAPRSTPIWCRPSRRTCWEITRDGVSASDLEAAFAHLPHRYASLFRYENFAPGYRSQRMKDALAKLEAALLITRVWPTASLDLPLAVRPRSAPQALASTSGSPHTPWARASPWRPSPSTGC